MWVGPALLKQFCNDSSLRVLKTLFPPQPHWLLIPVSSSAIARHRAALFSTILFTGWSEEFPFAGE